MPVPQLGSLSVTHYTILGLAKPNDPDDPFFTPELVKSAYRRALLKYHPDRSPRPDKHEGNLNTEEARLEMENVTIKPSVTIDQIIEAYEVLSDPTARKQYHDLLNRRNVLGNSVSANSQVKERFAETVDLEDFELVSQGGGGVDENWAYERKCRCGGVYRVLEGELEAVTEKIQTGDVDGIAGDRGIGEVLVGCGGCSLVVRVVFGVVEG